MKALVYTLQVETKLGMGVYGIAVFVTIMKSPPFSFLQCKWTALFTFKNTVHRIRRRSCLVVIFLNTKRECIISVKMAISAVAALN